MSPFASTHTPNPLIGSSGSFKRSFLDAGPHRGASQGQQVAWQSKHNHTDCDGAMGEFETVPNEAFFKKKKKILMRVSIDFWSKRDLD